MEALQDPAGITQLPAQGGSLIFISEFEEIMNFFNPLTGCDRGTFHVTSFKQGTSPMSRTSHVNSTNLQEHLGSILHCNITCQSNKSVALLNVW